MRDWSGAEASETSVAMDWILERRNWCGSFLVACLDSRARAREKAKIFKRGGDRKERDEERRKTS